LFPHCIPRSEIDKLSDVTFAQVALNRAQKFLNEGNIQGAKDFVSQGDIQEHLGARGLQAATDAIRVEQNRAKTQNNINQQLRVKAPYKFLEKAGAE